MIHPRINHNEFSPPHELAATLPTAPCFASVSDVSADLQMDRHAIRRSAMALAQYGVMVTYDHDRIALDRDTMFTAQKLANEYVESVYPD